MNKIGQYKINYGGEWVKLPLFFKGDSLQIKIEGGHLWSSYDGATWEDVGELNTNVDLALDPNSNNPIANSAVANAIKGGIRFACVVNSENIPKLEAINGKIYGTWIAPYDGAEEVTREFQLGDIIILVTTDSREIYLDEHSTKEFILTDDGEYPKPVWVELGDVTPAQGMINELLKNYYKKTETYNKSEVDTKIENIDITNTSSPIVRGDANNSAVLKGEYSGYSNNAISQTSIAIGGAANAGLKGWYYSGIDFTNKKIYLSRTQPNSIKTSKFTTDTSITLDDIQGPEEGLLIKKRGKYIAGDFLSIVMDKKFENKCKIESVEPGIITVDKIPFTEDDLVSYALGIGMMPDDFTIYSVVDSINSTTKQLSVRNWNQGDIDLGGASLAEGADTYAVNIGAHAEGGQTMAKGQYSHAEGLRTQANYAAHAEGVYTEAIGRNSHAEGNRAKSIGDDSHAEGDRTESHGAQSHAEGASTKSFGDNAHSEGESTIAIGNASHSEGRYTVANVTGAHAEGRYSIANDYGAHAEGGQDSNANAELKLTSVSGNDKQYTYSSGNPHMYNACYVNLNNSHVIAQITAIDTTNKIITLDKTIGNLSNVIVRFAGYAGGVCSHSEGSWSVAVKNSAHAEGYATYANALASHAEGHTTTASGDGSHAEGRNTIASNQGSHAEGRMTLSNGDSAHSEGYKTTADGAASHAEGWENIASEEASHAEGRDTKAIGKYSHAEGKNTQATNVNTHSEGYYSIASGDTSHAEGCRGLALGGYSHVEGYGTTIPDNITGLSNDDIETLWDANKNFNIVKGSTSHSEGVNNLVLGNYSHGEGGNVKVNGNYSHAEGKSTIASGSNSHVEGYGSVATGNGAHAEGGYYKSDSDKAIGGTATGEGAHAEGIMTKATAKGTHAEGDTTKATKHGAHAEGRLTESTGDSSHSEGYKTKATGAASHAEGWGTITNNTFEHASGQFNKSTKSSNRAEATLFSIGMGTSDSDDGRKNAFEVKQNGDIYIAGLAGVLQDYLAGSIAGVIPLPPVKIQTFGDSITDNHWGDNSSWVSFISDNISSESLTVINSAVAGAALGLRRETDILSQVTSGCSRSDGSDAPPLDTEADIVVVFGGTNDYSTGYSIEDASNNLAEIFEFISSHSRAKVLFCTPMQRYNAADQGFNTNAEGVPINPLGKTLREYCEELIRVCVRFSVPVCDLNAESNINRFNLNIYSSDGLHPNIDGDAYLSKIICKKIKELAETL